jgi:D-amino-acid dehydrogenase
MRFLRNCTAERARVNTKRKVRLCLYSQARLQHVAAETGVQYHALKGGLLYLYRDPASFERGTANTRILTEEGLELADQRRCRRRIDPALAAVKHKIAGAIHCPSDESGDCRVFTQGLARHIAEKFGVVFKYDTEITGFDTAGDEVTAVRSTAGPVAADKFVFCLGVFGPKLARQLGVSLQIYPVKGYSVTWPIDGANNPPTVGAIDEDTLCAYVRLGDRLRATSIAEFAGYDKSFKPEDFRHMLGVIRDLFPGADYAQPSYWAGLRPMTPEGTPIRCRALSQYDLQHRPRPHRLTMSIGSARIAADPRAWQQARAAARRHDGRLNAQRGHHARFVTIAAGADGSASLLVEGQHTAPRVGSGRVSVLATPVMINLIEAAALAAIEDRCPPAARASASTSMSATR